MTTLSLFGCPPEACWGALTHTHLIRFQQETFEFNVCFPQRGRELVPSVCGIVYIFYKSFIDQYCSLITASGEIEDARWVFIVIQIRDSCVVLSVLMLAHIAVWLGGCQPKENESCQVTYRFLETIRMQSRGGRDVWLAVWWRQVIKESSSLSRCWGSFIPVSAQISLKTAFIERCSSLWRLYLKSF